MTDLSRMTMLEKGDVDKRFRKAEARLAKARREYAAAESELIRAEREYRGATFGSPYHAILSEKQGE